MSGQQQLNLEQIDQRFSSLRLASPRELSRLRASVHGEGRIRDPLLVSTGVQPQCWVLIDGFKRLRVAHELGLAQVWVQAMPLDAAQAKAAILQCNQARQGLCELEQAWIVHSLHREQAMKQIDIAQLLKRDKSWVSRRLKLVESLEENLQNDVRLGLLSATTARELAQLPRGNQQRAAQAINDHQLSTRQCASLVQRLRKTRDPQAISEILGDPLSYLADEKAAKHISEDARLSEDGNRLRRLLLSWQDLCGLLGRDLRLQVSAADARLLTEVLLDAVHSAKRVLRQLEAVHRASSSQLPPQSLKEQPAAPGQAAAHA